MEKKTFIVSVLLLMVAASVLPIAHAGATLGLPDAEFMHSEFAKQWGPGTLTLKTNIPDPGVRFDFTGLTSSDTGIGDN